ncbi:hypothetical protein TB2_005203 [Malus domestica]
MKSNHLNTEIPLTFSRRTRLSLWVSNFRIPGRSERQTPCSENPIDPEAEQNRERYNQNATKDRRLALIPLTAREAPTMAADLVLTQPSETGFSSLSRWSWFSSVSSDTSSPSSCYPTKSLMPKSSKKGLPLNSNYACLLY